MKKLFELYEIDNGYLVKEFDDNRKATYKSFQVDARNPQIIDMFNYFIKITKEKGLRTINYQEYLKVKMRDEKAIS